ncbi:MULTISPECIES: hypothetical protein [unclassified Agrococcus]|uniref:hypothetical protein n=1 Tax=unclassified Agrococcus TaxID=2615065 RepID=UPI003618E950
MSDRPADDADARAAQPRDAGTEAHADRTDDVAGATGARDAAAARGPAATAGDAADREAAERDAAELEAAERDAAELDAAELDAADREADERDEPVRSPIVVERDDVQVRARLVPRYGRFMVLGAILGLAGGWLWARLGSSGPLLGVGPTIDTSSVVPFLMAVGAVAGIVVGAVVAIVLDRLVGRRRRTVTAERTRHHRTDQHD